MVSQFHRLFEKIEKIELKKEENPYEKWGKSKVEGRNKNT